MFGHRRKVETLKTKHDVAGLIRALDDHESATREAATIALIELSKNDESVTREINESGSAATLFSILMTMSQKDVGV